VLAAETGLPGADAHASNEGDRPIVEPVRRRSLLALLATREPTEEDFPEVRDHPPEPVDL
jgi:antitoxin VapB